MSSFYTQEELQQIGFKHLGGDDIHISRKTSIYGAEKMSIGNHIRIDDYSFLSGRIILHNYIHIAPFCVLYGGEFGIEMEDFSGLSSRSAIYAHSDDYSGNVLTNPTVPDKYCNTIGGKVVFQRHVVVGTGSTILSGVTLHEGVAVGSMSLVNKSLEGWGIYAGCPCRKLKERSKELLKFEQQLLLEITK